MRLPARLLAVLLGLLLSSPVHAATLLESSRSAVVSTFVDVSGTFTDADAVGFGTDAPGPFLEAAVVGVGFGDLANASGEAVQDSTLETAPEGAIRGVGSGAAGVVFDVFDPGFPSRANGTADTQLSIVFEVEEPSAFALSVSLRAELSELSLFSGSGSVESEVTAVWRLSGLASGLLFERAVRDDTPDDLAEVDDFAVEGTLASDSYLFEVFATTRLRGFEDASGLGSSGFGLSLVVVPEPGSALLMVLGLALLACSGPRDTGRGGGSRAADRAG